MRNECACAAPLLIGLLLVSCGHPPAADTALILRQRSLGALLEVTVVDTQLNIVAIENRNVSERVTVNITRDRSEEIRELFWDAFRHQPTQRLNPVRDLVFEQEWRGKARSQRVRIQGYPLTSEDRRAYDSINPLLPPRFRFLVDEEPYSRRRP